MDVLPWWHEKRPDAELAAVVWSRADAILQRMTIRNARDLAYEAIYRGRPLQGGRMPEGAPAHINIAKSKAQAIHSRWVKHQSYPTITAEDAGYAEDRFARRASAVLRSQLGQTARQADLIMRKRDALTRGTGVAKVVRTDAGDVGVERIPRSELLVNPREARYGCPRSIFHIKSYPLEVALAMFGDTRQDREAIEAAASQATTEDRHVLLWGEDWADESWQVPLLECHHLRSSSDAKDGVRVVACRGRTLVREKWNRPRLPYALLHWDPPTAGMFGEGLISDLAPIQQKINDVARDIQEALHYGGQLTVFTTRGSVKKELLLRTRHPRVVEVDGPRPEYSAGQIVSPQQLTFLEWLINIADDLSGISRDYQSGKTQLGPNASGRAIEAQDDIQTDRFAVAQLWDSLHMVDVGTLMLDEARAIAEDLGSSAAAWIREHRWSEIDIDGGRHALRMEPINSLAGDLSGKLSQVNELALGGYIDKEGALELLSMPDLERAQRRVLGPRRAVQRMMDLIADPSVDLMSLTPDAYFPVQAGIDAAVAERAEAWAKGASKETKGRVILERFNAWIQLAEHRKQQAAKAAASAMAGVGAGPGAAPAAGGQPPGEPMAAPPNQAAPGMTPAP